MNFSWNPCITYCFLNCFFSLSKKQVTFSQVITHIRSAGCAAVLGLVSVSVSRFWAGISVVLLTFPSELQEGHIGSSHEVLQQQLTKQERKRVNPRAFSVSERCLCISGRRIFPFRSGSCSSHFGFYLHRFLLERDPGLLEQWLLKSSETCEQLHAPAPRSSQQLSHVRLGGPPPRLRFWWSSRSLRVSLVFLQVQFLNVLLLFLLLQGFPEWKESQLLLLPIWQKQKVSHSFFSLFCCSLLSI